MIKNSAKIFLIK